MSSSGWTSPAIASVSFLNFVTTCRDYVMLTGNVLPKARICKLDWLMGSRLLKLPMRKQLVAQQTSSQLLMAISFHTAYFLPRLLGLYYSSEGVAQCWNFSNIFFSSSLYRCWTFELWHLFECCFIGCILFVKHKSVIFWWQNLIKAVGYGQLCPYFVCNTALQCGHLKFFCTPSLRCYFYIR